jgi:hemolysin III
MGPADLVVDDDIDASSTAVDPAMPYCDERPTWRGRLHTWAFLLAIPAGAALIVAADGAGATAAASIYVASVLIGFGTSASYHRLAQSPRARAVMQRCDHSTIYLLILGTYVPMCIVALPPAWGIPILSVVGAGALLGIVLKVALFHHVPWLGQALYPILGWIAVIAAPALVDTLSTVELLLIVGGGVAYTVGFPVLFLRRPDPWPTRFGYHEVWHAFTVVAALMHFTAIAAIVS